MRSPDAALALVLSPITPLLLLLAPHCMAAHNGRRNILLANAPVPEAEPQWIAVRECGRA